MRTSRRSIRHCSATSSAAPRPTTRCSRSAIFLAPGTTRFTADPAADITIGAGTYWIGVTPILNNLSATGTGWQFAYAGTIPTDSAHYAELGAVTGTSTTPSTAEVWEFKALNGYALTIEGTRVPEPSTIAMARFGQCGWFRRDASVAVVTGALMVVYRPAVDQAVRGRSLMLCLGLPGVFVWTLGGTGREKNDAVAFHLLPPSGYRLRSGGRDLRHWRPTR